MSRSVSTALRRGAALAAALASGGCSLGSGTFLGPMAPGGQTNIAQKGDARLHLAEKSGAFGGAQGAVGTQMGNSCCS